MKQSIYDILKDGGYLIYARHGEANAGVDQPNLNLLNCLTQRNLSSAGRVQATYFGTALRRLKIPIDYPVRSSPFCRSLETAERAFGVGRVKTEPFLGEINRLSGSISKAEQQGIVKQLEAELEKIPPKGYNQVIVAHNLPEGVALGQIPNMGAVIVKPFGSGNGYEVIARLTLHDLIRQAYTEVGNTMIGQAYTYQEKALRMR